MNGGPKGPVDRHDSPEEAGRARWFPLITCILHMKLLRHLRQKYMAISSNASAHYQKHYDYCPHCEEKTPWMARVLSGYYRCLQCGNNPLTRPADEEPAAARPTEHRMTA